MARAPIAASRLLKNASKTVFFCCDIQERFQPLIFEMSSVVSSAVALVSVLRAVVALWSPAVASPPGAPCHWALSGRATQCDTAKILSHPVVVTEQYPKAFGHTVPELDGHEDGKRVAKKTFSMLTPEVHDRLTGLSFFSEEESAHAVLFGIEAHVCVQQTALELLEAGVVVHVVADAVSSQRPSDRATALRMLADAGAMVTSTEAAMLGLVGGADHPKFKDVSKRLIDHNKAWGEGSHWAGLHSDGLTARST